jgi:Uma2 family endonuclease
MVATANLTNSVWDVNFSSIELTDAQFDRLCADNPDLRIEMNARRELIIMPPAFGETGERNFDLIVQLGIWNRQTRLGRAFDSSTGYILPDGSKPSPDVSWIEKSRLVGVSLNQFIPISTDFVILLGRGYANELRSSTDRLPPLQQKMQTYRANGVRLGWLINPQDRTVEIYRAGQEPELLTSPTAVSGEEVLPGFNLDLTTIW